ncbi:hypothetical protein DKX38_002369 [Salix brachista]|uniref:Proteasome subunit beta n=1 Tax=Salix brachista TaxID=2182728 RepID=A0A5N5NQR5_9ROSI|nr:hypothetical protein DKX38_002369 [Salix brachista]
MELPQQKRKTQRSPKFSFMLSSSSLASLRNPQFSDVFEYNGSAIVAMVGKNCFAIASDRRLGVNLQTVATDFQRIYKIHDKLFIGLSGLGTDAQTLYQRLVFRHKLYQLREERDMKPETFANLVSAVLYEKRFGPYFCQPVIAGLGDDDKPFICTMDSIGAKELAKDFVVAGSASESLYGACEAFFKPDMEPDELFEVVSQALLASVDRDCVSGWGGHIYIVENPEGKDGLTAAPLMSNRAPDLSCQTREAGNPNSNVGESRVQYLRKSFRPRTHRMRVGLGSDFDYGFKRIPRAKHGEQIITVHNVRMTHTSQSVLKGSSLSR